MVYFREILNDLIQCINIQDVPSKGNFIQKLQINSIIFEFSHFLFFPLLVSSHEIEFHSISNIFFIPRIISFIFIQSYLTLQKRP